MFTPATLTLLLAATLYPTVRQTPQANEGFVTVHGITAESETGGLSPDVEAQTRRALENLRTALQREGLTLAHVVAVNVFLADARHFQAMNGVYRTFFVDDPPTRATVRADLASPGALVQISAVATRDLDARSVIKPADLKSPELPYSWGVQVKNTLFLAGATSRDPETYQPVTGNVATQTRRVMQNIGLVLRAANMDYGDVTSCKVFLDDPREFGSMNEVYGSFFPSDDPPARATVRAGLMNPAFLVEIQCVAVQDEHRRFVIADGATRSRSPFSPAIETENQLHLAGMVGRGPNGLALGDVEAQTHQTMENIRNTLLAANLEWQDVKDVMIWIDDIRHAEAVRRIYAEIMPTAPPMAIVGSQLMSSDALVEIMMTATRPEQDNPLNPFQRLVGGEWYLDDAYHTFEWGVARRVVRSKSYFVIDGSPKLVSEGLWYWHEGEQAIKGVAVATDMPVNFFEYTTVFRGDTMINELVSFGDQGGRYLETWRFLDEDRYQWDLFTRDGDETTPAMGGTYVRRR